MHYRRYECSITILMHGENVNNIIYFVLYTNNSPRRKTIIFIFHENYKPDKDIATVDFVRMIGIEFAAFFYLV